jgi:hypothetical protein
LNLGLGISMCTMSFFMTIYYTMLMGYSILYFILSFRSKLDWATCGPWASQSRMVEIDLIDIDFWLDCTDDFSTFIMRCNYENTFKDPNGRCYTWTSQGLTQVGWWNIQSRIEYRKPVLPSDDYFKYILTINHFWMKELLLVFSFIS